MTDINTWAAVDDSNNVAAPAGWPEGMMPSGVNNSARAMMGSLKRWRDQSQPTVTATGSGNAQIITYPVAPATLASGDTFCFFALANTGAATLQVNAQAAKAVMTSIGTALIGGEMPAGAAVMVVYDGTNFRMLAAPTPLSVSNGGTGATTPGTAADAIGAVKDTGDTMTGNLTVPSIVYSNNPYGHAISFGWDGSYTNVYVDGSNVGVIGDITAVVAGNGLSGGGSVGPVTIGMSGSFSGNFSATGNIVASAIVQGATVTSTDGMNAAGQVSGNTVIGNAITSNGNVTAASSLIAPNISSNSGTIHTSSQWAYDAHVYDGTHGWHYNGLVAFSWAAVYSFGYPGASDRRLKTDIQELPGNCAALVNAIRPRRFKWREGVTILDHTRTHWGFVAQEVGAAFGAAGLDFAGHQVGDDEARSETLDSTEMVAVLWQACREMAARLKQLEER